jgi:uncharacterized protein YxjI
MTNNCPKCSYNSETAFDECPRCGIIVEKFLKIEKDRKDIIETRELDIQKDMQNLADAQALFIKQQKESAEIIFGYESKNRYSINNGQYLAMEEGGSLIAYLLRWWLRGLRPFTLRVLSSRDNLVFKLHRPFRFYFHKLEVYLPSGRRIGTILRRFNFLTRRYCVYDNTGREIYQVLGPILRPWTFKIVADGQKKGFIQKKWSGMFKETFSDADNFGVEFPKGINVNKKALLLGAVFLIDFLHFEH